MDKMRGRSLVGSPEAVRERAEELSGRLGVEELVVLTICPSFEARVRSYELLAGAVGLTASAVDSRGAQA